MENYRLVFARELSTRISGTCIRRGAPRAIGQRGCLRRKKKENEVGMERPCGDGQANISLR